MARVCHLNFTLELTDEQRLLNGARYCTLEGESSEGEWGITLSFGQPKEPGAAIEEGDLTLSRAEGELFAELVEGWIESEVDELAGHEQDRLELRLRVHGGEGRFAGAGGEVRLAGILSAGHADLRADAEIQFAGEEMQQDGCS